MLLIYNKTHLLLKNSTFMETYITRFDIFFTDRDQYIMLKLKYNRIDVNDSKILIIFASISKVI